MDDIQSCVKFAEGHANVLKDYGVTKVTSAKTDWFYNPGVYVVIVENSETGIVVGGERIHLEQPGYQLPIEEAISVVDNRIHSLIDQYAENNVTGEICGLWNAKSIAGKGVSILLTKMGVAIARMIGMDSLFVLCAPYTVEMCINSGFEIETSIGNEGKFIYPKLDLIATALVVKDVNALRLDATYNQEISYFYESPVSSIVVDGQKGKTEVEYDITFSRLRNTYG